MKKILLLVALLHMPLCLPHDDEQPELPRINFVSSLYEHNISYVTIYYSSVCEHQTTLHSLLISAKEFESACTFGLHINTDYFQEYAHEQGNFYRLIIDQSSCKITNTTPAQAYGCAHIVADNENLEPIDARCLLTQAQEQLFETYQTLLLCGITFSFFLEPTTATNLTPSAQQCAAQQNLTKLHQFLLNHNIPIEHSYYKPQTNEYILSLKFAPALRTADNFVLCKHLIERFAYEQNLSCFFTTPNTNSTPPFMHVHLNSLTMPLRENLFFDEEDTWLLSPKAYTLCQAILENQTRACQLLHIKKDNTQSIPPGIAYLFKNYFITVPTVSSKLPPAIRICLPHAQPTCNPYEVFTWIIELMLQNW